MIEPLMQLTAEAQDIFPTNKCITIENFKEWLNKKRLEYINLWEQRNRMVWDKKYQKTPYDWLLEELQDSPVVSRLVNDDR